MSKRYFLNNFDTFFGKALLSELIKEDVEEPTLMATYKDSTRTEKPKNFKKILKREKPKLSRKKMLEECDVFLYDLDSSDPKDINFIFESLQNATLEESKVLILVSNVMVWALTPQKEKAIIKTEENQENEENQELKRPLEEEEKEALNEIDSKEVKENEESFQKEEEEGSLENNPPVIIEEPPKEYAPFQEEHYKDRVPHPSFQTEKELEDLVLSLQRENLKVIVICAGILYGKGEILLHKFLEVFFIN